MTCDEDAERIFDQASVSKIESIPQQERSVANGAVSPRNRIETKFGDIFMPTQGFPESIN